jgi:hypothetical protein
LRLGLVDEDVITILETVVIFTIDTVCHVYRLKGTTGVRYRETGYLFWLTELETSKTDIRIDTSFARLEIEILINIQLIINTINKIGLNSLLKIG